MTLRYLIRQPDNGLYMLYSDVADSIVRVDLTRAECCDWFITGPIWDSKKHQEETLDRMDAGGGFFTDKPWIDTWAEAMATFKQQQEHQNLDIDMDEDELDRLSCTSLDKWEQHYRGLSTPEQHKAAMDEVRAVYLPRSQASLDHEKLMRELRGDKAPELK